MKKKLHIAVRELVGHVLRSGDLELEFLSSSRPVEGIRAHQKIQRARPDNYIPEVTVSYQIETDRFILGIGGRIDGVYQYADRVVVDEIKTTTRDPASFEKKENKLHWAQVKVYAYIYACENGLDKIDTQLTYCHLDTGEIKEFGRSFIQSDLETFFKALVENYLEWAGTIADWCGFRDKSIQALEFPHAAYRPGQRKMAVEVYRTIRNEGRLIIQAATGIGKTMGVIFPAVKGMAQGLGEKIFYLTARTTGRTVAEKAFNDLRKTGLKMKTITLTAKDKICFSPEASCTADECEFARGYYDRLGNALKQAFQQDAFTRETLEEISGLYRVCPFEFSLDLSIWADCVICDYNYAFDPRVFLRRFFLEENKNHIFLVDEAHNLVDRSRDMFSAVISKKPFLDMRREVKQELPLIYKSMGRVNSWMVMARKRCVESGKPLTQKDPPEALYPLLKEFLKETEAWLTLNIKTGFRKDLLNLYFESIGFIRISEGYDDKYATCIERDEKDLRVKLFCIDPSGLMKKALNRCGSAIFFSATMTPLNYFQKIFGCDETTKKLVFGSPFPRENLGVFLADSISTLYRQRSMTKSRVTETICAMTRQKTGNYLLFFPSYQYMSMIHEIFISINSGIETIVQTPGMSERERDEFILKFSGENQDPLVGFAVMGGIFGEGIDLVGKRLSGAVIVGVGLPAISPERDLIREYFSQTHKTGFEYAYQYPGINRVLQAAGRVIRSGKDRGSLLLVDQRFSSFRYKSLLPAEWTPKKIRTIAQFETDLKDFWEDGTKSG